MKKDMEENLLRIQESIDAQIEQEEIYVNISKKEFKYVQMMMLLNWLFNTYKRDLIMKSNDYYWNVTLIRRKE